MSIRSDVHSASGYKLYSAGLTASMGDKEQLLDFVPKNARVLDLGCGNGDLLAALEQRSVAYSLHGWDFSSHLLIEAANKLQNVQLVHGEIGESTWDYVRRNGIDCIIVSSVMHELLSAQVTGISPHAYEDWMHDMHGHLKYGTRIIIRDGCAAPSNAKISFSFLNENQTNFNEILAFSDFATRYELARPDLFVSVLDGEAVYTMNADFGIEFLTKYIYMQRWRDNLDDGWSAELKEKFHWITSEDYDVLNPVLPTYHRTRYYHTSYAKDYTLDFFAQKWQESFRFVNTPLPKTHSIRVFDVM